MHCRSCLVFIWNATLGWNGLKDNINYRRLNLNLSLPKYFLGSFVSRTQNSSENSKLFWRLSLMAKGWGIFSIAWTWYLTRGFIFDLLWHFITNCDRYYYKILKKFITKYISFLIQNATVLLQNAAVITNCDDFIPKCDRYYKMRQHIAFELKDSCCTYSPETDLA